MINFLRKKGGNQDTSDATASASDIISNKTAYVKGRKITGTIIPTYDTASVSLESETLSIASPLQIVCALPDIDLRYSFGIDSVNIYTLDGTFIKSQSLFSNIRSVDTISYEGSYYICINTYISDTQCGIYVYKINKETGDLTQIYNNTITTSQHWGQHRIAAAEEHPWFALCCRSYADSYVWIWTIDTSTDTVSLNNQYLHRNYNMDTDWMKWTNHDKYIIIQGNDYNHNFLLTIDSNGNCTECNYGSKYVWDIISDNLACDITSGTLRYCQWAYPRTMTVISSIATGRTDWKNICYLPNCNVIVLFGNRMRAYKINASDNSLIQLFDVEDHYQRPDNGNNFDQWSKLYGITTVAFTNTTYEFYADTSDQKLIGLNRNGVNFIRENI